MLQLREAEHFYTSLLEGSLALAPNHRLAVALHETWGRLHRERGGAGVCPSPDIRAVDVWLRDSWRSLVAGDVHPLAPRQLLSGQQEHLLWCEVIEDSRAAASLLNPRASARAASQAHALMQQNLLAPERLRQWLTEEWRLQEDYLDLSHFLLWQREFQARLERNGLLTLTEVLKLLIEALDNGLLPRPSRLLLYAFTSPPPLYRRLFSALCDDGATLALELQPFRSPPRALRCGTPLQEISAAAQWAEALFAGDPAARIGIVSTGLGQRGALIERVFSQRETLRRRLDPTPPMLEREAPVHAALALLRLNLPQQPTLELCRLLRSPWLGGAKTESAPRAALERELRNRAESTLAPVRLREYCQREKAACHCPDLYARLQRLAELGRQAMHKMLSPAQCIGIFIAQLEAMGWPGDGDFGAYEARIVEDWHRLLENFLGVHAWRPALQLSEALALLRELAASTAASGAGSSSSLQILGPLEAENLQFDHLWLMGLNDHLWPAPMQPNALLPFALQKELGLPETDRDAHFEAWRDLAHKLLGNTSGELILSHAETEDELGLRPAGFLRELPAAEAPATASDTLAPGYRLLRESPGALENLEDAALLPLRGDENPRGGATLLQNQSACPFRALAIHRLDAGELPSPGYGLSYLALGNMLHHAMETVWQELGDYRRLLELDTPARRELAAAAAQAAVRHIARDYPVLMRPRFRELERERLTGLVLHWLSLEEERPFERVLELERSLALEFEGLQLNLKVDRIDLLGNDRLRIVDYKSGRELSIDWLDPRPAQPQLMLYLLAVEKHYPRYSVSALLYAFINARGSKFKGLANDDCDYPGLGLRDNRQLRATESDWAGLTALWRQGLDTLAGEFRAGLHMLAPRSPALCRQCHVRPFCRIDERTAPPESGEAENVATEPDF